jgi:AraC-like DNA-binding protein
MHNKLFSPKWGELAINGYLHPSDKLLQLTGAQLQVATNNNRDYNFIFQELKDEYHTVRFYRFSSKNRETYTWVSDPMICLRIGWEGSNIFHLPYLGNQVFHKRDYNLLLIPNNSSEFTLGPHASVSFMDIILDEGYLHSMQTAFPKLTDFIDKVERGLPARFSYRNCIASIEMLRWLDELHHVTSLSDKEQTRRGYITHQLIKAAFEGLTDCKIIRTLKLNPYDIGKIYQVADFMETYTQTITLKQLAETFGISSYKLDKGFKEIFGYSVLHHRYEERMRQALRFVNDKRYSSKQVADMLGYSEPQSFSRAFRKRFGHAPYRNAPKYAI